MRNTTNENIKRLIDTNKDHLYCRSVTKMTKDFYVEDVKLLLRREMTELFEYKYLWHLVNVLVVIIVTYIVSIFFDSGIGIYDDCYGLSHNNTCQQLNRFTMVDMNLSYLSIFLLIITFIQSMSTALIKLKKTKIFLYQRQHSLVFFY